MHVKIMIQKSKCIKEDKLKISTALKRLNSFFEAIFPLSYDSVGKVLPDKMWEKKSNRNFKNDLTDFSYANNVYFVTNTTNNLYSKQTSNLLNLFFFF